MWRPGQRGKLVGVLKEGWTWWLTFSVMNAIWWNSHNSLPTERQPESVLEWTGVEPGKTCFMALTAPWCSCYCMFLECRLTVSIIQFETNWWIIHVQIKPVCTVLQLKRVCYPVMALSCLGNVARSSWTASRDNNIVRPAFVCWFVLWSFKGPHSIKSPLS